MSQEREALPLSLLNDYFYCPRRAALKVVEGWRSANEHTERGDIVHEHSDLAGYEVVKGVMLLRALPVFSERLGLSGKCDIVEAEFRSASNVKFEISNLKSLKPVEFKVGCRREFENDDAQLCAQALCLEEMFNVSVPRGAVFHAQSKRRRDVEFNAALRGRTEQAVTELRAFLPQSEMSDLRFEIPKLPPARYIAGRCEECSLFEICLPKATGADNRAERLTRELFQI
jgi:CRISPR-associated exonuclease Cas4